MRHHPVHLSVIIFAIVSTALLMAGCSASPPVIPVEKISEADLPPSEAIPRLGDEIDAARKDQIDILSPSLFNQAEQAFLNAREAAEAKNDPAVVNEHIHTSRLYLYDAAENAKIAHTVMGSTIQNRNAALAAGADQMGGKKYQEIEARFSALTRAIEKSNIRYARKNADDVADDFKKLELRAIRKAAVGEISEILEKAEEDHITQYAPQSFALADDLLETTKKFIYDNPYAKDEIYEMARHNLFMTRRALAIADHSKAIADMPPEEIAFYIEDTLGEIAREIGLADMRDQKFYIQVDTIKKSIESLLDDNQMLGEKLALKEKRMAALQADYEKQVSGLSQQIIFLEGKTAEKEAINEELQEKQQQMQEKLKAERQFHSQFIKVQEYFKPEEADVYKKGNQLMIRLKGIRFPVGQAVIMPNSYQLLSKVQKAIKTFGAPAVVIEGHTDSTGTHKLNNQLSRERADAVRQYLIANQTLPADNLTAAGYGSERPLASNATAEGRAANRRIDVIIIPKTDSKFQ